MAGEGRPSEMSGAAIFLAASSVVVFVGRGSSTRGFCVTGISSACGDGGGGGGIVCGGGGAIYKGFVRFAAFRRTVTVRFRFGPLITGSVGMGDSASAWSMDVLAGTCAVSVVKTGSSLIPWALVDEEGSIVLALGFSFD